MRTPGTVTANPEPVTVNPETVTGDLGTVTKDLGRGHRTSHRDGKTSSYLGLGARSFRDILLTSRKRSRSIYASAAFATRTVYANTSDMDGSKHMYNLHVYIRFNHNIYNTDLCTDIVLQ